MFFVTVLFACLAVCSSHAVLPLVVPAVHTVHAPVLAPHAWHHGYAGHGLIAPGLLAKPLGHHILKRSPHLVAPLGHVAHVAPLAHVAPVAVSHQSRLDVRTAPAVVAAPVVPIIKPIVAPVISPLIHKPVIAAPLHYGAGHGLYGAGFGHYGAGHLGHY